MGVMPCFGRSQNTTGQPTSVAPAITPAQITRIRAEIEKVEGLLPQLPDRGTGLYFLARPYAQLGELTKALALLKECFPLGEGFDPRGCTCVPALESQSGISETLGAGTCQYPPVRRAESH
jgi:hypothetical protein